LILFKLPDAVFYSTADIIVSYFYWRIDEIHEVLCFHDFLPLINVTVSFAIFILMQLIEYFNLAVSVVAEGSAFLQ
jgi:hypothetical protein